MLRLGNFFSPRKRLLEQEQAIKALQQELTTLRSQNNSMREGMRRRLICSYRLDAKHQIRDMLK